MDHLDATIHLAFAFDIGYEIDLDRARAVLPGESGLLARRRRTPESIQYRPAPLRLTLSTPRAWPCPAGVATIQATSGRADGLRLRGDLADGPVPRPMRLPPSCSNWPGDLADPGPLNMAARLVVNPWIERLKPVVDGFEVSDLSEEYIDLPGRRRPARLDRRQYDWIARPDPARSRPPQRGGGPRGDPAGLLVHARTTSSCSTGRPVSWPTPTAPIPCR